jgi:hypothetical protein
MRRPGRRCSHSLKHAKGETLNHTSAPTPADINVVHHPLYVSRSLMRLRAHPERDAAVTLRGSPCACQWPLASLSFGHSQGESA